MTRSLVVAAVAGLAFSLAACDVDQTEEGEMPEVNVEGGNMPEYEADAADVDVGTTTETVEVPTVDVGEADAGAEEQREDAQ
jgi:hypothetical protein